MLNPNITYICFIFFFLNNYIKDNNKLSLVVYFNSSEITRLNFDLDTTRFSKKSSVKKVGSII